MMEKESKCPRGVYKVKTYGTLQEALEKDQNNHWTGKDHKESNTDVQQQVRFQNDESILRLAVCIVIDINRE